MEAEKDPRYQDLLDGLKEAYDGSAAERDRHEKEAWKVEERAAFVERLRAEKLHRLLEVGAGTGQDSAFFARLGFDVVATDLSPEMVAHCRAKGLDARVMDSLHLSFESGSFDAVYSLTVDFHVVGEGVKRFQSLTLRRSAPAV